MTDGTHTSICMHYPEMRHLKDVAKMRKMTLSALLVSTTLEKYPMSSLPEQPRVNGKCPRYVKRLARDFPRTNGRKHVLTGDEIPDTLKKAISRFVKNANPAEYFGPWTVDKIIRKYHRDHM